MTLHDAPPRPRSDAGFLAQMRIALLLVLASLAVAAVGVPLMRMLGVEARADEGSAAEPTPAGAEPGR